MSIRKEEENSSETVTYMVNISETTQMLLAQIAAEQSEIFEKPLTETDVCGTFIKLGILIDERNGALNSKILICSKTRNDGIMRLDITPEISPDLLKERYKVRVSNYRVVANIERFAKRHEMSEEELIEGYINMGLLIYRLVEHADMQLLVHENGTIEPLRLF